MNRFKKVLQLKGFPIDKAEMELESMMNLAEKDFQRVLEQKRDLILDYHLRHNSTYASLLKSYSIKSWEDIPMMTKADLQKPLQQRLSEPYKTSTVFKNKTSGSSGHPFTFAKDKYAHALTWAHILGVYRQHDIDINSSYEARFYGIPRDFMGYNKERLKDRLALRHRFDIFDLSDYQLHKFLDIFRKKPFDYINGYTSAIVLFAKFLKSQQVILNQVCPSLKLCITTSEMLFEEDRRLLEKQLGVKVVNEYGASELGVIAFENRKGEWVINSQTLYVEVLDDDGKILPHGKEGNIVITSLYNKAHPFIRYQIGDRGILDEHSTAQLPVLKSLTGRTHAFAILPSGKKVPALSFYYVTKSVIEDTGAVKEIQIIQERLDTFCIQYKASEELNAKQKQRIQKAIDQYLDEGLILRYDRREVLERSPSGKLKQFTSKVNDQSLKS